MNSARLALSNLVSPILMDPPAAVSRHAAGVFMSLRAAVVLAARTVAFMTMVMLPAGPSAAAEPEPDISTATATFTATAGPPANDAFARAATLVTGTVATATNVGATLETDEPVPADFQPGRMYSGTMWWNWTAPATGHFDISTKGTSFDTVLTVWTGESLKDLKPAAPAEGGARRDFLKDEWDHDLPRSHFPLMARVRGGKSLFNVARLHATAGTRYRIAVAGMGRNQTGTVTLGAAPSPPPPPNDSFADRIPLATATPWSSTVRSVLWQGIIAGATREAGEPGPPHVRPEENSVWFTWTAPASGLYHFGGGFGDYYCPGLSVWTGSRLDSLRFVSSGRGKLVEWHATAGAVYQLAVMTAGWNEPVRQCTVWISPVEEHSFLTGAAATGTVLSADSVDVTDADRTVQAEFTLQGQGHEQGQKQGPDATGGGFVSVHRRGLVSLEFPWSAARPLSGAPSGTIHTAPILLPRGLRPSTAWVAGPGGSMTALEVVNTGAVDETEPVLNSLELEFSSVDVTTGDYRTIPVTVRAADAGTGVQAIYGGLFHTLTGTFAGEMWLNAARRVSGTDRDGVWAGKIIIQPDSDPGACALQVMVEDLNGNWSYYADRTGHPLPGPHPGRVTVLKGLTTTVLSFSTTPERVDISDGPQEMTATIRIAADTGLELVEGSFGFYDGGAPVGRGWPNAWLREDQRIQGTGADNTYVVRLTIPAGMPPGIYSPHLGMKWQVAGVANPGGSQWGGDGHGQLAPDFRRWPAHVQQGVEIINHGLVDREPPVLAAVTVPDPVMTRVDSSWWLGFSMTVTDNLDPEPWYEAFLTDADGNRIAEAGSYTRPTRTVSGMSLPKRQVVHPSVTKAHFEARLPPGPCRLTVSDHHNSPAGGYCLAVTVRDMLGNTRTWRSNLPDFPGPFHGYITKSEAPATAPK